MVIKGKNDKKMDLMPGMKYEFEELKQTDGPLVSFILKLKVKVFSIISCSFKKNDAFSSRRK